MDADEHRFHDGVFLFEFICVHLRASVVCPDFVYA